MTPNGITCQAPFCLTDATHTVKRPPATDFDAAMMRPGEHYVTGRFCDDHATRICRGDTAARAEPLPRCGQPPTPCHCTPL